MAISVVVAVGDGRPTRSSTRSRRGLPKLRIGPGTEPDSRDGPARSPASTATRSPATSTRAAGAGATVVVDGRDAPVGDGRRLLPRRVAARRRRARHGRCTPTRSSGRCSAVVRVDTYDEARAAGQRQPVRQRHGHLHPRRRRGPAVPVRRATAAWSASTCPIPVPVAYYSFGGWKASLFGDTHMYGPEGDPVLHPHQGRHDALARPGDRRRSTSASRGRARSTSWISASSCRPTRPPWRVVELAKQAEAARLQPRVDVRLAHAVAGAVRHLQPDPGRHPQGHGRARW